MNTQFTENRIILIPNFDSRPTTCGLCRETGEPSAPFTAILADVSAHDRWVCPTCLGNPEKFAQQDLDWAIGEFNKTVVEGKAAIHAAAHARFLSLRTNLPDHTKASRESLGAAEARCEQLEQQIAERNEHLHLAESALREAESRTSGVETKAADVDVNDSTQAAIEIGEHHLNLSRLRTAFAATQKRVSGEVPKLQDELRSANEDLQATKDAILKGYFRNAVELYGERIARVNLFGLARHVRDTAYRAGISLGKSQWDHPVLLDPEGNVEIGPWTISKRSQKEDFYGMHAPADAANDDAEAE